MAGILDTVNQRTQLVGQNRLELLLFKLTGRQRFGINVFKVKEVLQCPPLTSIPRLHPFVRGLAHIRGKTISVIDLGQAIGGRPIQDLSKCFIIIAEYNRSIQGFLVESVERIVNINWEAILPPPKGAGRYSYLTAVTEIENELVEILDVEKILDEIAPTDTEVSGDLIDRTLADTIAGRAVLIADDSSVARNQINRALSSLGLTTKLVKDGKEALDLLKEEAESVDDIREKYALLISDVEMPEMDGYTLTAEIRNNPKLQGLYVILHTSLSGVFNEAMVKKVGADDFIPKFNPDELAGAVTQAIEKSNK
ncbi:MULTISPECIES: chemotaxis protein CheV [Corallincola]|uniref:Chemotaxis protein CheV n=2 Tax=Corallincola TaxID=1775176 RepID=A0A368N5R3_9GAMM|nr:MULTISPECIES: chemotaxis protein CheV [Corallincola]RCU44599.1 chemotaxis protein CheV [Corallincola holothuriorum]TAA40344.1 chemotaxis signal transduction protein CheV [Corallincola spongiicola]